MDQDNKNHFQVMIDFIKKDNTLDEEVKARYVGAVEVLSKGEALDEELSREVMVYLDALFKEIEDEAIASGDYQAVEELAEMRQERDKIFAQAVSGQPAAEPTPALEASEAPAGPAEQTEELIK